jgi:hypothetical protein
MQRPTAITATRPFAEPNTRTLNTHEMNVKVMNIGARSAQLIVSNGINKVATVALKLFKTNAGDEQ